MKFSAYFRIFLTVATGLIVANLLLTNDYVSIWSGAETEQLLAVVSDSAQNFPQILQQFIHDAFGFSPFWWRAVTVAILLGGVWFFYKVGKQVFGEAAVVVALLVLGSSLLLVNLGKFATTDVPLSVGTMMLALLTLLGLKQPEKNWKWGYLIALGFTVAIAPAPACIFALVFSLLLYFLHPLGKQLPIALFAGAPVTAFALAALLNGGVGFENFQYVDFLTRTDYGGYLLAQIIGFLPWFGFLLAALWNNIVQWRKGEELGLITGLWLLAALVSSSLASQWILALIVGKTVTNYFRKGYPYRGVVQAGAVLQIVFIFCAAVFGMIGGLFSIGPTGFRVSMVLTAAYWIPAFVGLIGLVGKNRRATIAGTALSGILATLVFWIMIAPVVEQQRLRPAEVVQAANRISAGSYFIPEIDPMVSKETQLYLHGNFEENPLQNDMPGVRRLQFLPYLQDSLTVLPKYQGRKIERVQDVWLVE